MLYHNPSDIFRPRNPTPLSDLLAELRKPFRSVYPALPPTAKDRMKINIPRNLMDDSQLILCDAIMSYDKDIAHLQSSTWFMNVIQKALAENDWPTDDKAITSPGRYTKKRAWVKTSRLQHMHSLWKSSKGLSRSSKRVASPTPEPSPKHHRGTPAASDHVLIV